MLVRRRGLHRCLAVGSHNGVGIGVTSMPPVTQGNKAGAQFCQRLCRLQWKYCGRDSKIRPHREMNTRPFVFYNNVSAVGTINKKLQLRKSEAGNSNKWHCFMKFLLLSPSMMKTQKDPQTNKEIPWPLVQQANSTDWATATCRRNLVPTFVDRGVSRGQRGGSPTVVNLSFLDR
jgi:hypothetical protein